METHPPEPSTSTEDPAVMPPSATSSMRKFIHETPHHSKDILKKLNQQREDGLLCDVTIIVEGRRFRAHKSMLAACSSYFNSVFTRKDVKHIPFVEITDITAEGFSQVLEHTYTSKLALDENNVASVMEAAQVLKIIVISDICSKYLQSQLKRGVTIDLNAAGDGNHDYEDISESEASLGYQDDVENDEDYDPKKEGARVTATSKRSQTTTRSATAAAGGTNTAPKDDTLVGFSPLVGAGDKLMLTKESGEEQGEDVKPDVKRRRTESSEPATPEATPTSPLPPRRRRQRLSTETHTCNDCGKVCTTYGNLMQHQKNKHTDDKPFECEVCHQKFAQQGHFIRHQRLHELEKQEVFQCNICEDKSFGTVSNLTQHLKTDHTIKKNSKDKNCRCKLCKELFVRTPELIRHVQKMHLQSGEAMYKCDECDKPFKDVWKLNRHKMKHSGIKPFQCEICGAQFIAEDLLNTHQKRHTGENLHECEYCNMKFVEAGRLKEHIRKHTGEKPFPCTYCDMKFAHPNNLRIHTRKHTGEKPYVCEFCGQQFAYGTAYKFHRRIHTGEMPYQCQECGKRHRTKAGLDMHVRKHGGVRPFTCKYCQKGFWGKTDLVRHIRTHTGEKPYMCDVCGSRFAMSSQMYSHRRTHSDERPHRCEECELTFKDLNSLKRHRRIHSGDFPYHCPLCGKGYTRSDKLKDHVKQHEKGRVTTVSRTRKPRTQPPAVAKQEQDMAQQWQQALQEAESASAQLSRTIDVHELQSLGVQTEHIVRPAPVQPTQVAVSTYPGNFVPQMIPQLMFNPSADERIHITAEEAQRLHIPVSVSVAADDRMHMPAESVERLPM
ncbi:uncharacterized protein LOC144902731 isoform X2 [Branchiostoma floridae x Branchiostoma belcheri]